MINLFAGAFSNLVKLCKNCYLHLLALFFIISINYYLFFPDLEILQVSPDPKILLNLIFFLLIYLVIYIYTIFLIGYEFFSDKSMNFLSFTQIKFTKVFTDLMRAYNYIILWSLLFILPGVYKYLRYVFVPYIAFEFDQTKASEEQVDSLKESKRLTGSLKVFFAVLFVLILSFPAEFISTSFKPTTLPNIALMSLLALVPIIFHCVIVAIYKNTQQNMLSK